jgi:hypothetical protein
MIQLNSHLAASLATEVGEAVLGLLAFFIAYKVFTKVSGHGDREWAIKWNKEVREGNGRDSVEVPQVDNKKETLGCILGIIVLIALAMLFQSSD